jgi:hypothetical protein
LIRPEPSRDEPAVSCLDHPPGTVAQALGENVRDAIRSRCARGVSIQTAFSGTLEGAMLASFGLALSAGSLCPNGNRLNPRKPASSAGIDRRGGLPGTLRRGDFRHGRVQAVRVLRPPPTGESGPVLAPAAACARPGTRSAAVIGCRMPGVRSPHLPPLRKSAASARNGRRRIGGMDRFPV